MLIPPITSARCLRTHARVGGPRPNAYSCYKQTAGLAVHDQTLIPQQYLAVAPSRRQGWECPRPNAYPTNPSRRQGWECTRPNAYPTNPISRWGWQYPRPKINPLFVPNGLVAVTPILPKLKLVIFTVALHGKMYYTLKLKILHYN